MPFFHCPRSHSQVTVERFWFNSTAWHRDVMTSRHDITKFIFLSQLVDNVLERRFFFVSMKLWVAEFENVVSFVFAWWRHVMTSCHDVKKKLYSISACRSARRYYSFLFLWFSVLLSIKMLSFLCLHEVMTWCHATKLTNFSYISLSMF